MVIWFGLGLVLGVLILERRALERYRERVLLRIHVHGTRGKSGIVRALAARLRERGWIVLAKTTGDAPEYIRPDGQVEPIRRRGPARIQEHVQALRRATREGAQVLVVEGMALQPETIYQSEQMLQATHAVVCNVRPDHAETMGSGRTGVLSAMHMMFPRHGVLYFGDEAGTRCLKRLAQESAVPYVVAHGNRLDRGEAIVEAMLADIDTRYGDSVVQSTPIGADHRSQSPPVAEGGHVVHRFSRDGVDVEFIDLLSANDVTSVRLIWQSLAVGPQPGRLSVALFASRADRPLRTRAFVDWLCTEASFDLIMFAGDHAGYAHWRARTGPRRRIGGHLGPMTWPWAGPDRELRGLVEAARRRQASRLTIVGMGNAHGAGSRWREYMDAMR